MAVAQALPSSNADGSVIVPNRTGKYGEAYVLPLTGKELFSADEGSYFMALTPTPGTGIIGTVNIAAITDVSPTMVVYNGDSTKRLYPQFLNLHETVVSTSGARVQFTWYTDNINRWTSSGTALTIGSTNSGGAANSTTAIHVGTAMVSPAASARVLIDHVVFAGALDVVENQYEFIFGGTAGHVSNAAVVTTVQHYSKIMPPVCIMPGHSLVMHQWAASQANAPTFEYRFGFILR